MGFNSAFKGLNFNSLRITVSASYKIPEVMEGIVL